MIEILFAIAILALGLLMIAAVFPVAIKWTQQDANKTIGQVIANNALGIIETKYTAATITAGLNSVSLSPLPYMGTSYGAGSLLTLNDRTYEFGGYSPYPAPSVTPANTSHYYWTALARLSPNQPTGGTSVDLYILVFYKGDYSYTYTPTSYATALPAPTGSTDTGARGTVNEGGIPFVAYTTQMTQSGTTAPPFPIGAIGIDDATGAVFRKIVNANTGDIVRSDGGSTSDTVLYCPPADNATASPLIYVYTTTVTF